MPAIPNDGDCQYVKDYLGNVSETDLLQQQSRQIQSQT